MSWENNCPLFLLGKMSYKIKSFQQSNTECQPTWWLARWVPIYRMYRTLSANLPDVKQRSVPRLDHLSVGLSCWQTCSWVPAIRHVIIGYIIAILACGEDAIKWNIFLAVYDSVRLHNRLICKSDCMQKFWGKNWRSEFVLNLALKVNPKRWIFSLGSNGSCMHSLWLLESDCVL